ncbi:MAG TPA: hypothetical protein VLH15_08455 [Dehalococcoidales bacterium]|nr:hypothetical protein [Dehalococcoidales bacterium]
MNLAKAEKPLTAECLEEAMESKRELVRKNGVRLRFHETDG